MTNNNTPRLLPQIQPGSSSTSLSPNPPFRFSHIRDRNHRQKSTQRFWAPDPPSAPSTLPKHPQEADHSKDSQAGPSQTPSRCIPSVLQMPSSPTTAYPKRTTSTITKGKRKRTGEGDKEKKERSKRRRGECHYKRTVEKPRGPPSWLVRSKSASIHPPLPPQSMRTDKSPTICPPLPIIPSSHPITAPTIAPTIPPSIHSASPIIISSPFYSLDRTCHQDDLGMASLRIPQPVIPIDNRSEVWAGTAVNLDGTMKMGNTGYMDSRRSSEPSIGAAGSMTYMDPMRCPIRVESDVSISLFGLPSTSLSYNTTSSSSSSSSIITSNPTFSLPPSDSDPIMSVSAYHPPVPFFEARPSHAPPSRMHLGTSPDPSSIPTSQVYPGGRYLKYS